MYPIALDLSKVSVLLIGSGPLLARREEQLREAGATKLHIYHSREGGNPWPEIPQQVRDDSAIVMVCGLAREVAEVTVRDARAAGKLVNAEDITDLCDFYFTANVRRGDLLIAVSTGGASPTLARRVRDAIGRMFGEEWEARTREIAQYRLSLKQQGKGMKDVLAASEDFLKQKGWLQ